MTSGRKHDEIDAVGLEDVLFRCRSWVEGKEGDGDVFADILSEWLEVTGKPPRSVAAEFEMSVATVKRWADGTTVPPSGTQDIVVETLKDASASILEDIRNDL